MSIDGVKPLEIPDVHPGKTSTLSKVIKATITGAVLTVSVAVWYVFHKPSLAEPRDEDDRKMLLTDNCYPIDVMNLQEGVDLVGLLRAGSEVQLGDIFLKIESSNEETTLVLCCKGQSPVRVRFTDQTNQSTFKDIVSGETECTLRTGHVPVGATSANLNFKTNHWLLRLIGMSEASIPAHELAGLFDEIAKSKEHQSRHVLCVTFAGGKKDFPVLFHKTDDPKFVLAK
jgi:hypothetical protein